MTNPLQTIPNLPPALSLDGSEQVWLNQAGADVRTTVAAIGTITAPFVYLPLIGGTLTGPLNINADLTVQGYIHTPTPHPGTSSDVVATTAFVMNAVNGSLGSYLPILGGTIQGNLAVTGTTTLGGATTLNGLTTATAAVDLTGAFPGGSGPNAGFALAVDVPAGAYINLNGTGAGIAGARGAIRRWLMLLGNGTPESGGNVGSDFTIQNLSDAGASLGTALTITRATGAVSLSGALTVAGVTTLNGAAAFNGATTTVTQPPGNNTTLLATTAFVEAALTGSTAGVASFNGRTGAVTLTTADVNAAGGPYLPLAGGTLTGTLNTQNVIIPGGTTPPAAGTYTPYLYAYGAVLPVGGNMMWNGYINAAGNAFLSQVAGVSASIGSGGNDLYFSTYTSTQNDGTTTLNSRIELGNGALTMDSTSNTSLILAHNPTAAMEAATKQYVDTATGAYLPLSGGAITGPVTAPTPTAGDNSTNVATTAFVHGYVPLTGGTMSGQLTIGGTAGLRLNKSAGQNNLLIGATAGTNRWQVILGDSTAESGSNAGSNFDINSYTDGGVLIGTQLSINRATGLTTVTDLSITTSKTANFVLAAPAGANGVPTFRALTAADVPTLAYLPLTGGTLTGNLTLSYALPIIYLNKTTATNSNFIAGQTNGVNRWSILLGDATAESGSNAGSNFQLVASADNGSSLGAALLINRATALATFTGAGIVVNTSNGGLGLNGTAASQRAIDFYTNGSDRWRIYANQVAESGSNAGSDFNISCFADNGAFIATPFQISRATGNATFSNTITSNNGRIISANSGGNPTISLWDSSGSGFVGCMWAGASPQTLNFGIANTAGVPTNQWGWFDNSANFHAAGNLYAAGNTVYLGTSGQGAISANNGPGINIGTGTSGNLANVIVYANTTQFQGDIQGNNHIMGNAVSGQSPQGTGYCMYGFFQSGSWYNAEKAGCNVSGTQAVMFYNNNANNMVWSTAASDRRKKSNFKPAGDALDVVKRLPVYDLDYDAGITSTLKGNRAIGEDWMPDGEVEHWPFSLIADEVGAIMPHAAIKNREDDGEHWVALHPTHLCATLWRAVQQLTEQNDALTARIAALEARA